MLTINAPYLFLAGQGLLAFFLAYFFWLNHPKASGSKALLGFGLCLLVFAFAIPYAINNLALVILICTLLNTSALLCLQFSLNKLLKVTTIQVTLWLLTLASALALLNYLGTARPLLTIAIALIFAANYCILLYWLNKQLRAQSPRHALFISISILFYAFAHLAINSIENLTFSENIIVNQQILMAVNLMICAGIAIIFAVITTLAKVKELYLTAFSQSKSDFITNVSHEIRTPMNGVVGMLSLLEQTPLSAQQKHKISIAKNSAYSLLAVLNQVLDLSKIESGTLEPETITVDIKQLIEETAETFALQCHLKDLELIIDTSQLNEQLITTDPSKVAQIITNLLSNAVKFTNNGEVTLKIALIAKNQESYLLDGTITDTGTGMTQHELSQLLDDKAEKEFTQAQSPSGSKLGLSITKTLCKLLNGSLSASSTPGQGSCFHFQVKVGNSEQPVLESAITDLSNCTLLIADSNKTSAALLNEQFSRLGASVITTTTEQETINTLEQQSTFDYAFISEKLFSRDLDDFAQHLSKVSTIKNTQFVLMAYFDSSYDKNALLSAGFAQLIYKPILSSSLNVILDKLIAHHEHQRANNQTPSNIKQPAKQLTGKTVLVVEDNKINQMVVLGVLKRMKARIFIANNGNEAIKLLKKKGSQIDLVLMDCLMPEMDGYQATQLIRKGEAGEDSRNIVIIALTASAMENEKAKCLALGMNEVLTKPINAEALGEAINFWLTPKENRYCQ